MLLLLKMISRIRLELLLRRRQHLGVHHRHRRLPHGLHWHRLLHLHGIVLLLGRICRLHLLLLHVHGIVLLLQRVCRLHLLLRQLHGVLLLLQGVCRP